MDHHVHRNPYNVFQAPPNPHPIFNHPPYFEMISVAIAASNEPEGLSKEAISRFIERNYTGLPPDHDALLTRHLKTLKSSRIVVVKKSYKFASSPDAGLEVPSSKTLNDQHPLDLVGVSASQPQKPVGHGPTPRPKPKGSEYEKEDTVVYLSSTEESDDESDDSFIWNGKKKKGQ